MYAANPQPTDATDGTQTRRAEGLFFSVGLIFQNGWPSDRRRPFACPAVGGGIIIHHRSDGLTNSPSFLSSQLTPNGE